MSQVGSKNAGSFVIKPQKLLCPVMHYAWGKCWQDSRVAALSTKAPNKFPWAELWVGAHPKAPCGFVDLASGFENLAAYIRSAPDLFLGKALVLDKEAELPFLFKVLSVGRALSIQAHPNSKQSQLLHYQDSARYPDTNEKKELAVALTPVELLCGFRSLPEIVGYLKNVGAGATSWLPTGYLDDLEIRAAISDNICEGDLIKDLLRKFLSRDPFEISQISLAIRTWLEAKRDLSQPEIHHFSCFHQFSPEDPGLIFFLFLRFLKLETMQAILIEPGTVHAYLSGDIVECLTNSDNVIRGGLTEKFCDFESLVEIANFEPTDLKVMAPSPDTSSLPDNGWMKFADLVAPFSLQISRQDRDEASANTDGGPELLFVESGQIILSCAAETHILSAGSALFMPAHLGRYDLKTQGARVFRVSWVDCNR